MPSRLPALDDAERNLHKQLPALQKLNKVLTCVVPLQQDPFLQESTASDPLTLAVEILTELIMTACEGYPEDVYAFLTCHSLAGGVSDASSLEI